MKRKQSRARNIAFIGIAASVAMVLSYIEFLLPPIFVAVPGIKVGLPNVMILYILYAMDIRYAAFVSFARLTLTAHLFGSAMTLAYSIAGAVISLAVMFILKKTDKLSPVGVSVAGGVFHNLGQVLVAILLLDTPQIAYYMIVLTVTGTLSGIFIGLCGAMLVKRLPPHRIFRGIR